MDEILNCNIHGFLTKDKIRIVTIKKIVYKRCRECQKEKDRKHAKTYRDKNKDYYKKKKAEHYHKKPELQIEANRRYRAKKPTKPE